MYQGLIDQDFRSSNDGNHAKDPGGTQSVSRSPVKVTPKMEGVRTLNVKSKHRDIEPVC